jgi:hypothetical protein
MSLASNKPNNQRLLNDYNFVAATLLVAGGVAASSFNLVQGTPYPTPEQIVLKVDTGVLSGSNTTAAFTVQDSADNVTFANVTTLGSISKTVGTPGVASAANVASWLLPPAIKQYVRVSCSLSAATTGNFTASLAF